MNETSISVDEGIQCSSEDFGALAVLAADCWLSLVFWLPGFLGAVF